MSLGRLQADTSIVVSLGGAPGGFGDVTGQETWG